MPVTDTVYGTDRGVAAPVAPASREGWRRLAVAGGQVVLLVLVVWRFHLESRTFLNILILAAVGFPVQALLPARWRWPFFALLSLASVGLAFGFGAGAILLGFGLGLIGLCHLPLRLPLRVGLLLCAGGGLALLRAGVGPDWVPHSLWPILGAMFMFRIALYLYYLIHRDAPFSPAHAVSYFFMLPNVSFPLFPVVDYKTFVRSHFDVEASVVHQAGVRMMLRGLVHLLLYRYVYYHLTLDGRELQDLGQLVQYLLSTFFLYLRVSGQFHLIIGLLHLYGFRLPETHHLYYLATGFTDFWRRINIYWKDFMMKLVYYPSFFRLRRLGNTPAIVLSTLVVFLATWVLHSYQWFWLRGTFPITGPDILFWGILAALVVLATLREAGAARQRRRPTESWNLGVALKTVGTFVTICVLWSLWSSESVGDWLTMWKVARTFDGADLLLVAGLLGGGILIGGRAWGARELAELRPVSLAAGPFYRNAGQVAAAAVGLLLLGTPTVQSLLPKRIAGQLASLRESRLSSRDEALQQRGYYENLDNVNRFNTQLWEVQARREDPDQCLAGGIARLRSDFLLWSLQPSKQAEVAGKSFSTNRWAMRDREHALAKPAGTFRIALLGPSDVMGWGVGDDESFEAVLERDLNSGRSPSEPTVEVLNFAVHGYSLLHQLALAEERIWRFEPDLVIIAAHYGVERTAIQSHLSRVIGAGIEIPYEFPRAVVERARLAPGMPEAAAFRAMAPHADSLVIWSISRLGQAIARRSVPAVLLALELPGQGTDSTGRMHQAAEAAGFLTIDLRNLLPGLGPAYVLGEGDRHPNADGHRAIAARLLQALAAVDPRIAPSASSHLHPVGSGDVQ